MTDAIAVLELDRLLEVAPEELDGHRRGLKAARSQRFDTISRNTEQLMARIDVATGTANAKVLLHPKSSPAVVQSGNQVLSTIMDFHASLGIGSDTRSTEARRWSDAAAEVKDRALETGAGRVHAAKRAGSGTLNRAKSIKGNLSSGIAERAHRLLSENNDEHDETAQ